VRAVRLCVGGRPIQIPDVESIARSVRKYCRLESRLSLLDFGIGSHGTRSKIIRGSAFFL
jgi:hypothetical protein